MPADAAHAARHASREPATAGPRLLPLAVAVLVLLGGARLMGGPLALVIASVGLLAAGFLLAAALWLSNGQRRGAWHVAGALVFAGFAAALLSDGHEAIAQLERMHAHVASAG